MSFDPNILVSSSFGDSTRSYLSGSEQVPYYIHDYLGESIEIAFGTADILNHYDQYEIFIRFLIFVDGMIPQLDRFQCNRTIGIFFGVILIWI